MNFMKVPDNDLQGYVESQLQTTITFSQSCTRMHTKNTQSHMEGFTKIDLFITMALLVYPCLQPWNLAKNLLLSLQYGWDAQHDSYS